MDKEKVVYTYDGISFSFKKERDPVTCCNLYKWALKIYAKWNNPIPNKWNNVWFHLYEVSRVFKLMEIKRGMVVDTGWQRRKWVVII